MLGVCAWMWMAVAPAQLGAAAPDVDPDLEVLPAEDGLPVRRRVPPTLQLARELGLGHAGQLMTFAGMAGTLVSATLLTGVGVNAGLTVLIQGSPQMCGCGGAPGQPAAAWMQATLLTGFVLVPLIPLVGVAVAAPFMLGESVAYVSGTALGWRHTGTSAWRAVLAAEGARLALIGAVGVAVGAALALVMALPSVLVMAALANSATPDVVASALPLGLVSAAFAGAVLMASLGAAELLSIPVRGAVYAWLRLGDLARGEEGTP